MQRRLFEQGTEVRAGQPLFQINPAPFKADMDTAAAALQRAEAALARAKVQTTRLKPLVEADAISRQVYDDSVSQRDQASADVAQARATLARRQLDLKFATVEAPITGRIEGPRDRGCARRQQRQPADGTHPADRPGLRGRAPAGRVARTLRGALAAQPDTAGNGLPVDVLRDDDSRYDVKGRMLFSGVNVDPGTGDVLLRVLVDNPKRELLPGMYVRAHPAWALRERADRAATGDRPRGRQAAGVGARRQEPGAPEGH